jgi:hypothetical protein
MGSFSAGPREPLWTAFVTTAPGPELGSNRCTPQNGMSVVSRPCGGLGQHAPSGLDLRDEFGRCREPRLEDGCSGPYFAETGGKPLFAEEAI